MGSQNYELVFLQLLMDLFTASGGSILATCSPVMIMAEFSSKSKVFGSIWPLQALSNHYYSVAEILWPNLIFFQICSFFNFGGKKEIIQNFKSCSK